MHRTALRLLVCLPLVCLVNPTAMAAPGPSLCVWDPVGAAGQMFSATKAYAAAMKKQGVNLTLKPYTDERVAAEDFKAGQCDALLATSIRTRPYNPVTAAIDSTGATTIVRNGKIDINASYEVVRKAMQVYASPAAAKLVVQDKYEVAGIIPMGALYAVVRDREIFKKGFAGVRLPAFENDKVQAYIFERVGAQAVPSDISNFVSKFNNGSVDAIFAPATSYVPLEIFRGVGTKGGVSRFPLSIMTAQIVVDRTRFPQGFGRKSSQYWVAQFDNVTANVRKAEAAIPEKVWVDYPAQQAEKFVTDQANLRLLLADKGFYSKGGLTMMKRLRCSVNASATDCADKGEIFWPEVKPK